MFIRLVTVCALLFSVFVTLVVGGNVRIVQGGQGNEDQGFVEIKNDGMWTRVCSVGWDDTDATVACTEAGKPGQATAVRNAADEFGPRTASTSFRYTKFRCNGDETTILDCSKRDDPEACSVGQEAGVICNGAALNTGPVNLSGSISPAEGNVEVRLNKVIGKICDVGWDDTDATVVCQELGHGDGKATRRGFFGSNPNKPFLFDQVRCNGDEDTIYACRASEDVRDDCTAENEAGVICEDAVHPVRLTQPRSDQNTEGNVEIQFGTSWKRVCDQGFGQQEADVICRQLGHTGPSTPLQGAPYGTKPRLSFFKFKCEGAEDEFFDCLRPADDPGCEDGDEAGVICTDA